MVDIRSQLNGVVLIDPADGSMYKAGEVTTGDITAETVATATAAAPTYVEGASSPLSQDLSGNLRCKVVGAAADDAAASGNPVLLGGKAVETDGTDPSSVSAENDAAIVRTDRNRRLLVSDTHPFLFRCNENHASAQTNNQLKAAPGAGLSLYITDIIVSNGATAGTVKLIEDEGGTPADLIGPLYLAINGGAALHLKTPIRLTANKSLGFTSVTVTTHTVTVLGYTAP